MNPANEVDEEDKVKNDEVIFNCQKKKKKTRSQIKKQSKSYITISSMFGEP
jgi:hypothetical protein